MNRFLARIRRWFRKNALPLLVAMMLTVLLILILWKRIVITIGPGELGVKYYRFGGGTEVEYVYQEGIHFLWPWDKMYIYNARIQEYRDTVDALTRDGLRVGVEYSTNYYPDRDSLGYLHKYLGPKYSETVIRPEVSAAVREVVRSYRPEELYFLDRDTIQQEILRKSMREMGGIKFIEFEDIMIRDIRLPDRVAEAIEQKLEERHRWLAYEYKIQRELEEEKRKVIEANGIRQFEQISDISILQWRGLEVTEKLSTSPNSKVVIFGSGDQELPVILGGPGGG